MPFEDVLYEVSRGIARVTINRPEYNNSIRIRTYEELAQALWMASDDENVRVVILGGAGGKAFSTGGDVEMAQAELTTEHGARRHMMRVSRVSDAILRMDKPVVCAINGMAAGSGVEIMMFCDLVIASDDASFAVSGTDVGGCLGWGIPQLLPLHVGMRRAEEIMLLSRRVPAEEAERIGMITRVVPKHQFEAEIDELARRIVGLSRIGVRVTKSALRAVKNIALSTQEATLELCAIAIAGPERIGSFNAMLSGERPHEKTEGRQFGKNTLMG